MKYEYIVIHIHKCAGHSFKSTLKEIFRDDVIKRNKGAYDFYSCDYDAVFQEKRAIQGHFYYSMIKPLHLEYNSKLITWLREPVERLISSYYFTMNKYLDGIRKKDHFNSEMTLQEFAEHKGNRNVLSKFIKPLDYSNFFFVGFVDQYATDLIRFGKLMNLDYELKPFRNNVGNNKKYTYATPACSIDESLRQLIRGLNQEDIELYNCFKEQHREKYSL